MIDWTYIQDHWDWAGHILEAVIMAGIVAVLFRLLVSWRIAWIIGLTFAAGHFHGREKRDYEVSVAMPTPHLEGYYFWNWSWDGLTDFWPTAVICVLLILPLARRRN
ncbi:hypothetical protein [Agrobacterium tumefaciens]|uniref:hypothetical protein n=1 Tax=Agrobacterium tumefaciens TaxID=358 RepID=UPI003B9F2346